MPEQVKRTSTKTTTKIKQSNEVGARRAILEDLFYDFHSSRRQIYLMNFFRGLFFGFGSVLGGTILIALLIWLLSQVGTLVPFLSDFIQQILDALSRGKQ